MSQAKVYSSQFSFQGMVEARANTLIERSSREEFALTRDPVFVYFAISRMEKILDN